MGAEEWYFAIAFSVFVVRGLYWAVFESEHVDEYGVRK